MQVKLDKEKQKEEKLVAKAIKEALAKQERIMIAKQKEINYQVSRFWAIPSSVTWLRVLACGLVGGVERQNSSIPMNRTLCK